MTAVEETLRQELQALAEARAQEGALSASVRVQRLVWEGEHADLLAQMEEAKVRVATLEGTVRTLAVMAAELTGEKKPAPGVEVRASTKVIVQDTAAALEWARASRIGYVPETIDAKAIEAAAGKAKLDLPFLKTETTFKALIATDLTKAVAQTAPAPTPILPEAA